MGTSKGSPFRRLAVIGAGNMGSGIAQKMATEGFPVILVDLDDEKVARGLGIIEKTLAEGVERRIFRPEKSREIRARIEGSADWAALADVDLVVEAVFEDRAVKREVFERLDRVCRPEAVLATNTSSLSVTELAAGTRRPERVLGLHYFYHPAKNRLVEVIGGEETDPAIARRAWSLQEHMGKTPIASADKPGFVVNRFFVPWLNEAVRCLEEAVSDLPTIEEAARRAFGVGMGPFELMNVTGIPIAFHAATSLGEAFGPLYAPADLLRRQVASARNWELGGEAEPSRLESVADRLRAVVFLVAASLVDEGVGTVEDTDIGARVGLRWPRGPFELMNRHGIERAATLAGALADRHGMPLPPLLAARLRSGRPFEFSLVRSETRDGIATLTLDRPDALNALNEELIAQLHEAFSTAAAEPGVSLIVITGAGKAFVAGADIRFFLRNLEAGDLDRIVAFTRAGHALFDDIDRSAKPVVARLDGLALGGGLELALACDSIIATPRAAMAFPETGIGIYPGLGGTQRAARRVGRGLAKWLIFTGETLRAADAESIGLVDRVVPHAELDEAIHRVIEEGPDSCRPRSTPPERYLRLESFFASNDAETLRAGKADTGGDEDLERAMRLVASKAPIALRVAGRLIEEGGTRALEEGLRMELDHLVEVFGTRDAREGLTSLGKRAPVFEGR